MTVWPPSALPGISPTGGEINRGDRSHIFDAADGAGVCFLPISPPVGEMPGRAEGGKPQPPTQAYRFNSHVVVRSPVSLSLPSFS
ncbi:hypothetical protein At1D132_07800 [Agrobacterium fabrum]|nr:hypothetical protein At1D132_07800 [Agrobacterium fabrum]